MAPEINQTNFKPSAAPASSRQEIIPITEVLNNFAQQFQFLEMKTKFGQNFYCSKGESSKEQSPTQYISSPTTKHGCAPATTLPASNKEEQFGTTLLSESVSATFNGQLAENENHKR